MRYKRFLFAVFALLTITTPSLALADIATSTQVVPIDPHNQADVLRALTSYFADIPVMIPIAKCESNFRQYTDSGSVLNGGSGGMIGVYQINKTVHKNFALSLGYDITTLEGNMQYARYLYQQDGTDPWISSESCWGSEALAQATSTSVAIITSPTITSILKLGSSGQEVLVLQQLLNAAGYKVAKTGDGSPGQETTKFGALTKAAVQRFQCAKGIVCKGTESSTGYGLVGAKTRVALLKANTVAIR